MIAHAETFPLRAKLFLREARRIARNSFDPAQYIVAVFGREGLMHYCFPTQRERMKLAKTDEYQQAAELTKCVEDQGKFVPPTRMRMN